jgi:hypothetical protein
MTVILLIPFLLVFKKPTIRNQPGKKNEQQPKYKNVEVYLRNTKNCKSSIHHFGKRETKKHHKKYA